MALKNPLIFPCTPSETPGVSGGPEIDYEMQSKSLEDDERDLMNIHLNFSIPFAERERFNSILLANILALTRDYNPSATYTDEELTKKANTFSTVIDSYSVKILNSIYAIERQIKDGNINISPTLARIQAVLSFLILVEAAQTNFYLSPEERQERYARLQGSYREFRSKLDPTLRSNFPEEENSYIRLVLLNCILTKDIRRPKVQNENQYISYANRVYSNFVELQVTWQDSLSAVDTRISSLLLSQESNTQGDTQKTIPFYELYLQFFKNQQVRSFLTYGITDWDFFNLVQTYFTDKEYRLIDFMNDPDKLIKTISPKFFTSKNLDFSAILDLNNKSLYSLLINTLRFFRTVGLGYESTMRLLSKDQINARDIYPFLNLFFKKTIKNDIPLTNSYTRESMEYHKKLLEAAVAIRILFLIYLVRKGIFNYHLSEWVPEEALEGMLGEK